jgi:hypothetical protein
MTILTVKLKKKIRVIRVHPWFAVFPELSQVGRSV